MEAAVIQCWARDRVPWGGIEYRPVGFGSRIFLTWLTVCLLLLVGCSGSPVTDSRRGHGDGKHQADRTVSVNASPAHDGADSDAEVLYKVGLCFRSGYIVPKIGEEAVRCFREAAERGYTRAQKQLAQAYYKGEGVERDCSEAMKWYKKAADKGDAAAQNNIGHMYKEGLGVDRDYPEAMKWLRKAARQGHAVAHCNIGHLYRGGLGVERDYSEAMKRCKKAAEKGHPGAANHVGWMYQEALRGLGVRSCFLTFYPAGQSCSLWSNGAQYGDRSPPESGWWPPFDRV